MFTLEQIDAVHARLGKMATIPEYVRALNAIGVKKYDSYLNDGHSEYFGFAGQKVISPPVHRNLTVCEIVSEEEFLLHLRLHEQGRTSYVEMSKGLAKSGIEKWTVSTENETMTYYDKMGNKMLIEELE